MSCSPVLIVGQDAETVGLFCSPEDTDPDAPSLWEKNWTAADWPDGDDLLEAIAAHNREHRPPKRRERTRKPKFGSGLGLAPGTKITQAPSSGA